MKSKVALTLLIGLPLLAYARPDLYKESEDFQYARSSPDEGNKSGFYKNQHGNMGGNYEKAYNMDNLAHRQYSDLATSVGGQVPINTHAGSTFGAASTSGTEYGGLNGGTSLGLNGGASLGLNGGTSLGLNGASNYESGANYRSSQTANSNRYATLASRSGAADSVQSGSRYSSSRYGANAAFEQAALGETLDDLSRTQDHMYYDTASGQYVQHRAHGQSSYVASSAVQDNSHLSSLSRPLIVNPIRIQVVPGRVVPLTIPVTAQRTNVHNSEDRYSHIQSRNQQEYDIGTAQNYDVNGIKTDANANNGASKNYQSSYNYRKEWERHGDPVPVTIPVVVPVDTIPASSSLHSASNLDRTQGSSVLYNSDSHVQSRNQEEYDTGNAQNYDVNGIKTDANANNGASRNYQSSYNYRKEWERHGSPVPVTLPVVVPVDTIPASSSLHTASSLDRSQGSSVRYNSGSRVASTGRRYDATQYADRSGYDSQARYGASQGSQLAVDSQVAGSQNVADVKSLSSSAADSEVFGGANTLAQVTPKSYQSSYSYHKSWERHGTPYVIKPATNADGSVALDASLGLDTAAAANQQQASSSYSRNSYRSSSAALTDASGRGYQSAKLCDANCYRSKRSARYNQQLEDFGERIVEPSPDIDRQAEDNIPVEIVGQHPIQDNYGFNVGINTFEKPEYGSKPGDDRYSFLFPSPPGRVSPAVDATNRGGDGRMYHPSWHQHALLNNHDQFGYGKSFHEPHTRIFDEYLTEIDKIAKEMADAMELKGTHMQTNFDATYDYPHFHHSQHMAPLSPHFHHFGHNRHYHDKEIFFNHNSQPDEPCDKHLTVTTIRSMTEDDILKRINDLQKELNIGQSTFIQAKPEITLSQNYPKTTDDNVLHVQNEKTPEEIEALSLTRNEHKPKTTTTENIQRETVTESNSIQQQREKDKNLEQEDLGQQTLDFGQETQDFGQQVIDEKWDGRTQLEPASVTLILQPQIPKRTKPLQNSFDQSEIELGQETQDIGQAFDNTYRKPNLIGESQHKPENTFDQSEIDLGQETQDIGQAFEIQSQHKPEKNFDQSDIDFGQQTQDFGQELESWGGQKQPEPESVSLTLQSQIPIQVKPKTDYVTRQYNQNEIDLGQQTQDFPDLVQQTQDIGQVFDNTYRKPNVIVESQHNPKNTFDQSEMDLGQETQDIGQAFDQQQDKDSEEMDLGQQTQDMGHVFRNKKNHPRKDSEEIDLGQQTQSMGYIFNHKETIQPRKDSEEMDLGQQTQDMGHIFNHKETIQPRKDSEEMDFGQQPQYMGHIFSHKETIQPRKDSEEMDFGQHTQDFGQISLDLGQQTQDIGHVFNHKHADSQEMDVGQQTQDFGQTIGLGLQGVPLQQISLDKNANNIEDDRKYDNLEIVEDPTTRKPGFWINLKSKLSNTFG